MTAKEMLSLNVGDTFSYVGQTVIIADWKCLHEPQFNRAGERIDAEPIIRWPNGRLTLISWLYWGECLTKAQENALAVGPQKSRW